MGQYVLCAALRALMLIKNDHSWAWVVVAPLVVCVECKSVEMQIATRVVTITRQSPVLVARHTHTERERERERERVSGCKTGGSQARRGETERQDNLARTGVWWARLGGVIADPSLY